MGERIRSARRDENGLTAVEVLIVITILAILAAIVIFAVGGITNRSYAAIGTPAHQSVATTSSQQPA
jgi:general secretion pathway protein G